jgi:hypothetical protein
MARRALYVTPMGDAPNTPWNKTMTAGWTRPHATHRVQGLTLNDLPKTSLIWRASVRSLEMLRKIMTVYRAVKNCSLVRLRAKDQVFVFSRGETPHDATVSDFPDIGVRVSLSNKRRSV